jgi:hypothetical protein
MMADVTTARDLDGRELAFLHLSDALAGVKPVGDGGDGHGKGHVGALLDVRTKGGRRHLLGLPDLCAWQRLIAEEQRERGSMLPDEAIGQPRSAALPFPASFAGQPAVNAEAVPALLSAWVTDLRAEVLSWPERPELTLVAGPIGALVHRFLALQPFIGGMDRLGRLLLLYFFAYAGAPVPVFPDDDRQAYERAMASAAGARDMVAELLRQAVRLPDGRIAERIGSFGAADRYGLDDGTTFMVEWHALAALQARWREQALVPV